MSNDATYSLKIYASDRVFYEGKAKSFVFPIEDGLYAVLAGHADSVIAVEGGEAKFTKWNNDLVEFAIGPGMVQVFHNRVVALVDTAEAPEDVNRRKAEEALSRAKENMRQRESIKEYQSSQATIARALSILKNEGKFT